MSYFSQIDEQGKVVRVSVVSDSDADAANRLASENGGTWVQSSKSIGRLGAGIGFTYIPELNGFQPPEPFASWSFNEDKWQWEPPVPMPADNKTYVWNEETISWKEFEA